MLVQFNLYNRLFCQIQNLGFTFYLYFLKNHSHFLYFSVHFFFISVIIHINDYYLCLYMEDFFTHEEKNYRSVNK